MPLEIPIFKMGCFYDKKLYQIGRERRDKKTTFQRRVFEKKIFTAVDKRPKKYVMKAAHMQLKKLDSDHQVTKMCVVAVRSTRTLSGGN